MAKYNAEPSTLYFTLADFHKSIEVRVSLLNSIRLLHISILNTINNSPVREA